MSEQSPFLIYKIECPLCKTINEFELIRVGAFTEEGRDTDFSPMNVKWRFPRYQAFHPLVFFAAMCSHCYYTRELTTKFKDWKNDNHFRAYRLKPTREIHLKQMEETDSVIKLMGDHVDASRYPNESGILKLLLAICDEQLAGHYNDLDVGRFYLRIGWVFREMDKGENPHLLTLKGLIYELDKAYVGVSGAIESFSTSASKMTSEVRAHFEADQLSADMASRMLAYKDKYDSTLSDLNNAASSSTESLGALRKLLDDYKSDLLGAEGDVSGVKYFSHSSFGEFLTLLSKSWDGIVTSEKEALEKAVSHYKKAFSDGRHISPGNQQIQASYLIAELSRRVGDYDEARQYFTSTIKTGQEFVYRNRNDQTRTALARKILELAIEQGRLNLEALKPA